MTGYDWVATAVGGVGLLGAVTAIAMCWWLRRTILARDEQAIIERIRAHEVSGLDGRGVPREMSEDEWDRYRRSIVRAVGGVGLIAAAGDALRRSPRAVHVTAAAGGVIVSGAAVATILSMLPQGAAQAPLVADPPSSRARARPEAAPTGAPTRSTPARGPVVPRAPRIARTPVLTAATPITPSLRPTPSPSPTPSSTHPSTMPTTPTPSPSTTAPAHGGTGDRCLIDIRLHELRARVCL